MSDLTAAVATLLGSARGGACRGSGAADRRRGAMGARVTAAGVMGVIESGLGLWIDASVAAVKGDKSFEGVKCAAEGE